MKAAHATTLLVVLVACGQCSVQGPHARPEVHTSLAGGTVARVDGRAITAAEVEAELHAHGGTPREALDRVVDARLLARYAAANGYATRGDVDRASRRLAVQELLARDVEGFVPRDSITDADVERAYAAAGTRFTTPERRAAVHVLVQVTQDAPAANADEARRLAEMARVELASSSDLDAVLDEWRRGGHETAFTIRCETLPLAAADGSYVRPFQDALFAIDASHLPSVATSVVRTTYGFHAIALTAMEPGTAVPLAEAAPRLRDELLVRRRRERLAALLTELAARTPPQVDPHAADGLAAVLP